MIFLWFFYDFSSFFWKMLFFLKIPWFLNNFQDFPRFFLTFYQISSKNSKNHKKTIKKIINFQGPSKNFGKIENLISPRGICDFFMIFLWFFYDFSSFFWKMLFFLKIPWFFNNFQDFPRCFSLLFTKFHRKTRKIIKKIINFQGPSKNFGKIENLISPRGIYDFFMIFPVFLENAIFSENSMVFEQFSRFS